MFWTLNRKWQPYRDASNLLPLEASQDQDAYSTIGPSARYTNIINPKTTFTCADRAWRLVVADDRMDR